MLVQHRRNDSKVLSGVDCTDEDMNNIADVLTHYLRRLLPENMEICVKDQCTDSGSGDTKFALANPLEERETATPYYLVITCTLHSL